VADFKRRNYGRGHAYYLGDRKLDGVTTLIGNGLPKPALVGWAGRTVAEKAVNEWDSLAELPPATRLSKLVKAPDEARNSAGVKGTRIHALADPIARGEEVVKPDELAGHVESCVRFLDEWDVETVYAERPVFHEKYLYGGTFDLLARIDGELWLLDWKTSASGAYGDTAFQLAAYGNSTHMELPDGSVVPMVKPDRYGVVWLRADGYDLYPYHVTPAVFREFLYIQQVAKAAGVCRDYKGDALTPPLRSNA
jgi:hypothetical protein